MIRVSKYTPAAGDAALDTLEGYDIAAIANVYGLSTDAKPTDGLATGSAFIEVDTGKLYLFDEVGATWTEVG